MGGFDGLADGGGRAQGREGRGRMGEPEPEGLSAWYKRACDQEASSALEALLGPVGSSQQDWSGYLLGGSIWSDKRGTEPKAAVQVSQDSGASSLDGLTVDLAGGPRRSSSPLGSSGSPPRLAAFDCGRRLSPAGQPGAPVVGDRKRKLTAALDRSDGLGCGPAPSDGQQRYPWIEGSARRDVRGRRPCDPGYDPSTIHIPALDLKRMTHFERQFWTIKSQRMDLVLFVRHGSFYNLFDVDCDIGMSVGLNLSGRRATNMWKCGCTKTSFDHWAARVLGLGLCVGRVEEMACSKGKGKILRRELVEVLTPGTATREAFDRGSSSAPLFCLVEDEVRDAYGVCIMDVLTARVSFGEFVDDAQRTLLKSMMAESSPSEIAFEQGNLKQMSAKILRSRKAWCASRGGGNIAITPLPRDKKNYVHLLCGASDADERRKLSLSISGKLSDTYFGGEAGSSSSVRENSASPLATASLLVCVRYLEDLNIARTLLPSCVFSELPLPGKSGSHYRSDTMFLDDRALRHLELLRGSTGGVAGSLFHYLDKTSSPAGQRLLAKWIAHPLLNVAEIEDRLDTTEFLSKNPVFCEAFQSQIEDTPDFERLVPRCLRILSCYGSEDGAGTGADRIAEPRTGCVVATPDLGVDTTQGQISPVMQLLEGLGALIDASSTLLEQIRCATPKAPGQTPLVSWFAEAAARASQPLGDLLSVLRPENFVRKTDEFAPSPGVCPAYDEADREVQALCASLDKGPEKELEIEEALAARKTALVSFLHGVRGKVLGCRAIWVELVRAAATLDVLIGFGRRINESRSLFSRPKFLSGRPELSITDAWHPLLSCYLTPEEIVHNTIRLGGAGLGSEIMLLTGPNMGGKSTLLRLSAVCAVMSQIGCYVPARDMRHTIFDRVFTRMGAEDRMIEGMSTFLVELQDTSVVLNHATSRSLVLLDELGRGTSTFDGTAIAHAVLQYLVRRVRCCALFATHYQALCQPPLQLGHMQLQFQDEGEGGGGAPSEVAPAFKLARGVAPHGSCGVALAKRAGLPDKILHRAASISRTTLALSDNS
ncbi:DNA mismatch repair protein [Chloropicon primus]|nr:DNA mismatch repair protein [Chloropicon primus]